MPEYSHPTELATVAPPLVAQYEPLRLPPERNPAAVYLASLAPGSRRSMQTALNLIAAWFTGGRHDAYSLNWAALRFQHTAALRSALAEHYAPASANHRLAALRGVLRCAWQLGQMDTESYHRAVAVGAVKGESLLRGRAVSGGELRALFDACASGKQPLGSRDAALLGVLYGAGLRRAEAVALTLEDYERSESAVIVRRGKGNKARLGYLPKGAVAALERWLSIRGEAPGALFVPLRKNGALELRHMTEDAVLKIVLRRARECALEHVSPHDFRRTLIGDLLERGADISTVQRMVGHADVSTTAKYDRRGETVKKRAADLIHVPAGDGAVNQSP